MPLTNCVDCGQPLSDAALTCPHCGSPGARRTGTGKAFKAVQLAVALIFIVSLIVAFAFDSTQALFWLCVKVCVPTGLFTLIAFGVTWWRKG